MFDKKSQNHFYVQDNNVYSTIVLEKEFIRVIVMDIIHFCIKIYSFWSKLGKKSVQLMRNIYELFYDSLQHSDGKMIVVLSIVMCFLSIIITNLLFYLVKRNNRFIVFERK
jgi:hypothetical protein